MSAIDNTLASQVQSFDPATPLAKMAQIQAADQELQQAQYKQKQYEVGAEMRGVAPFVNTPEFPQRWAEAADKLLQRGVIDPQAHERIRNSPSPLMLKSIISQTESPEMAFRKEEALRTQGNENRNFSLAQQRLRASQDKTPEGFEADPAGGLRPIKGGPQDPEYMGRVSTVSGKKNLPPGFEPTGDGGLKPIKGGPADPEYLRTKGDKQNAPSGYVWNDPTDPSKGLAAIPGGPAEKVDAEVAGRLGLAKSFLGELPEIRKRIENGELTGPIDATMAKGGIGGPGEIRRKVDSGAEALLRMLTGAGMNKEEAAQYTRRYQFSMTDTAKTALSKLDQLERELNSVGETVGKGRGGWQSPGASKAGGPKIAAPDRFKSLMKENGGDKAAAYKAMQDEGY